MQSRTFTTNTNAQNGNQYRFKGSRWLMSFIFLLAFSESLQFLIIYRIENEPIPESMVLRIKIHAQFRVFCRCLSPRLLSNGNFIDMDSTAMVSTGRKKRPSTTKINFGVELSVCVRGQDPKSDTVVAASVMAAGQKAFYACFACARIVDAAN